MIGLAPWESAVAIKGPQAPRHCATGGTLCAPVNRIFRVLAILTVLTASPALDAGRYTAKPASHTEYRAYVGNYTTKTDSKGIYEFRFDAATGKMSGLELAGETKDPSWVAVHPSGKYLYAANEMGKASTVSAFAIEPKSGKLTLLNEQISFLRELHQRKRGCLSNSCRRKARRTHRFADRPGHDGPEQEASGPLACALDRAFGEQSIGVCGRPGARPRIGLQI